jgi:inhibitor of KinA sporulation pathway (predicted exonuclease)
MSDSFNAIALDLEMNQPSRAIIQVGVCAGDLWTGNVLERAKWFIKIDEPLNPAIIALTGITDSDVAGGVMLSDVHEQLVAMRNRHNCFCNPITWGGDDSACLRAALGLEEGRFVFGHRVLDTKTLFQSWCISQRLKVQSGLAKSMSRVGLQFQGRKHDAGDDAYNTFRMYCWMLKKMRT